MARLVDGLEAFMPGLDVRLGRRVAALEPSGPDGLAVRVTLDDGTVIDADVAVVATPAYVAAPLLAGFAPEAAAHLSALDHASVPLTTFALDRSAMDVPAGVSGCLVPPDQGTLVTAVSYGTSKWAQWQDPDRDDVILRVSAGRVGDDRHLDLDDADLTAAMVDDLARLVGVAADPTEVRVTRWHRALPQYAPGHLARVDEVERALAPTPVAVAGAALRGVGIPACVHTAETAAARLGATWPTRRSLT
jgi:oxygen-dependent protoporphyrinogen oxidase